MSQVGQKATSLGFPGMSVCPSGADIAEGARQVRFVPTTDSCTAANGPLFDHLVGAAKQRLRDSYAEDFGRLEV